MTCKLTPDDQRVTHHTASIRDKTYHYVVASPPASQPAKGTILLLHRFPDLGFGWRYQVLMLTQDLGLRMIVPDMLGYGRTDAPASPQSYAYKSVCADLVALVDHVGVVGGGYAGEADQHNRFFVGGHDWGGAVAWRMALWHSARLRGVFSVCTPYFAPSKNGHFLPLAETAKMLPNFGYQQQFAGDELWQFIDAEPVRIRQFLQAMYGGTAVLSDEEVAAKKSPYLWDTTNGVSLDRLASVGPSPLLSRAELDYYATEFARRGLRGPTNWYRTQKYNYDDEREIVRKGGEARQRITVPSLMLSATSDMTLPPILAGRMDKYFSRLTKAQVPGGHWVLWESSVAVNEHIKTFLSPLLQGAVKAVL
ncbi:hypothetical protein SEPCBS119000_004109 [Sporothrix epigloea]|uniref:AB hydrolase-1 domain-containing protein n=1 Tax=Sporothrix epigloea TaxID=1892477 RepID=A0ABP0DQA5_9PEZI